MSEWIVLFDDHKATADLEESLFQGPIDEDGLLRLEEAQVFARVNGLRIEIFSNEHPPPHFRVSYQGETANYKIENCEKINGKLDKYARNIKRWHAEYKNLLIQKWNERRPSGCPVGVYKGE